MKMSMVYYPHDGVQEAVAVARYAEEAGLDCFFSTDSAYRCDPWITLTAIAQATTRIRLGPSAVRMAPTEPLAVGRALATLDNVSGGRVDAVIGLGTFGRRFADGAEFSPVKFIRETFPALREVLDNDRPVYQGNFHRFSVTDMPLTERSFQQPLPLAFGSSGGPKLIELSAEIADGVHLAPVYHRGACEYLIEHAQIGAERAGRDWRGLDLALGPLMCCAQDRDVAWEAARVHSAFYLPLVPPALFERINEVDCSYAEIEAVRDKWMEGDLPGAVALVSRELASLIAVAGTPAECLETLKRNVIGTGINHFYVMFVDGTHVRLILGEAPPEIPTIRQQLELYHREIMPGLLAAAAEAEAA